MGYTLRTYQKEIVHLEEKIEKLTNRNKELLHENKKYKSRIDTLMKNAENDSEVEKLRIQNGKLMVELNSYKRLHKNIKEQMKEVNELLNIKIKMGGFNNE